MLNGNPGGSRAEACDGIAVFRHEVRVGIKAGATEGADETMADAEDDREEDKEDDDEDGDEEVVVDATDAD